MGRVLTFPSRFQYLDVWLVDPQRIASVRDSKSENAFEIVLFSRKGIKAAFEHCPRNRFGANLFVVAKNSRILFS
jgi:hypothetical protein